jgi:hypothetical protein
MANDGTGVKMSGDLQTMAENDVLGRGFEVVGVDL